MKTFLFLVKSPPPSSPFPAPQLEATGKSNEQNRLFSGSSQSSRGTPGNAGGRHAQRTEQSRGTAPRGRAGGAPERSPNSRQRARGGGGGGSSAKTPRQGLAGVGWTQGEGPVALQAKARSEHTKAFRQETSLFNGGRGAYVSVGNEPTGELVRAPGRPVGAPSPGQGQGSAVQAGGPSVRPDRRRGLRGRRNQERGRGCRHKQRAELSCQPLVTMGRMAGEPVWAGGAERAAPDLSSAGNG